MIFVVLVKATDFTEFTEVVQKDGEIVELERYNIGTVPVVRAALISRKFLTGQVKGLTLMVEQSISLYHNQYCLECLKQDNKFTLLNTSNKSGYCSKHRELNPKRLDKKRSPKNK